MGRKRLWLRGVLTALVAVAASAPSLATTLIRSSVEGLVADNARVVSGKVVSVQSYWNNEGTFILTDVRFVADEILKGAPANREFTLTVMGGTVGDLTTLIVGGPELVPGQDYVLFLNNEDLPGAAAALTVRDLSQGIFDVVDTVAGKVAVSQANRIPLRPDRLGRTQPPGGAEGLALEKFKMDVRRLSLGLSVE